ncbi:hypothetical protein CATMIT_01546, partial [Catenibacterium mitsuokai DSM 15897]
MWEGFEPRCSCSRAPQPASRPERKASGPRLSRNDRFEAVPNIYRGKCRDSIARVVGLFAVAAAVAAVGSGRGGLVVGRQVELPGQDRSQHHLGRRGDDRAGRPRAGAGAPALGQLQLR